MKKILSMMVQNKTARGMYITMLVSLCLTALFTLLGEDSFAEVFGIVAFASLTAGVLIELLLSVSDKKI